MKNWGLTIVLITIFIANIVLIALLPPKIIAAVDSKSYGYIQVKVLDNYTLKPVENATVCVIENRSYNITDKNGNTQKVEVPIFRNSSYDNTLLRSWGEITLLVYKTGYASHISFYNEVYAGTTRVGIVCYLSPETTQTSITSSCETPNQSYLEALVLHYKK